jgi:hypothetical protein
MDSVTTQTPLLITAFTYYHSSDRKRAFLVAEVWDHELGHLIDPAESHVKLVEWGKAELTPVALVTFKEQVQAGDLVLFTPKL